MLKGKIININSTKYFVDANAKVYDCVLKGGFKKEKITPLVGDEVIFDEKVNRINEVLPRKNELLRPHVSNIDIALVMVSVKKPDLDLYLLDKLLVNIISSDIMPIVCFSKLDLLNKEEQKQIDVIKAYYESIGIKTIYNTEVSKFEDYAFGKIVCLTGQTGAGKSTFINKIDKSLNLETRPISDSLNRGVHTTRYVSLYKIKDYYVVDTPGFSFLDIGNVDIKKAFLEFNDYDCKYKDCSHINTDGCDVYPHVGKQIMQHRYDNYKRLIGEQIENSRKLFKK